MIVNLILLLISLAIYAGYGIPGLVYLVAAVLVSWLAGLLSQRWRWVGLISAMLNVLSLLLLKLQPFLGISWISAMGMSYFSLQIISYHVDVFRGKYLPEKNFLRYALYVAWIPHLLMGPIERYDAMLPQLSARHPINWDTLSAGCARALLGLFKKYVIAARVGVIVSAISTDTAQYSGAFALAAMLLYSVQLYCDFSGGMDLVLGVSRMVGITMSENFDTPYFSQSVQEFWRRWHITLGSWLRDYVYIPLGGSRKGSFRKICNTLVTFLVSGLWHGVEYLLWGLLNGLFVCVGNRLKTPSKTLNRIGTFLVISFLWAFFVWPDTATALHMLWSVVTTWNYGAFFAGVGTLGLTVGDWLVLAAALLLLWFFDAKKEDLLTKFRLCAPAGKTAVLCALGLVVLVFGMYGIGFDANAFIYGGF